MNLETEVYKILKKHKLTLKKREDVIVDLVDFINKREKQLILPVVSQQRELLLDYEKSKCPETWWMSKGQAEYEVEDFLANNCC